MVEFALYCKNTEWRETAKVLNLCRECKIQRTVHFPLFCDQEFWSGAPNTWLWMYQLTGRDLAGHEGNFQLLQSCLVQSLRVKPHLRTS